jgi:hypothetical protein
MISHVTPITWHSWIFAGTAIRGTINDMVNRAKGE